MMTKKSFSLLSDGAEIVFQLFRLAAKPQTSLSSLHSQAALEKRITTHCEALVHIGTHKFPSTRAEIYRNSHSHPFLDGYFLYHITAAAALPPSTKLYKISSLKFLVC